MGNQKQVSLSKEEEGCCPGNVLTPSTLVQNRPTAPEEIPGVLELESRNLYLILDRVDNEMYAHRNSFTAWLFYADSDHISAELQRRLKEGGNIKNPLTTLCEDGTQTHFPKINFGNKIRLTFEIDTRNKGQHNSSAFFSIDKKTQEFTRASITTPSDTLKRTNPRNWTFLNLSIPHCCFNCTVTGNRYGQSEVPFHIKVRTDNFPDVDLPYVMHVGNYKETYLLERTNPSYQLDQDTVDYIKTHLQETDLVITILAEQGVLVDQDKVNLNENHEAKIDELLRILTERDNRYQAFVTALEATDLYRNRQIAERLRSL